MKSPDKMLTAIVVGIIALVLIVFAVVLTRPEVEYRTDDTPEGVAFNYLLAIQNEDYDKAYGYLSPLLKDYPASVIEFKRDIQYDRWRFREDSSVSLDIISTDLISATEAVVSVSETWFNSGGLFSSSQSATDFSIILNMIDGAWKIVDADYYFASCWSTTRDCTEFGIYP